MRDETNAMVGAQELCLPKEKAQETEDQLQKESRRWEEWLAPQTPKWNG